MSKSHAKSITVKARSYGGSNFLYDCLSGGFAFKTYEYLWGAKQVTFECCALNWAADKSYNALAIYSDRGVEAYEEYEADSATTRTVSCTIGSVTGDSFLIEPSAGTYLSATDFIWTCYIFHMIYKKQQDLTHGYYLIPVYFSVPYTRRLNTEFEAAIGVKAAYGGTGTPSEQRYHFQLVELYNGGQTLLDEEIVFMEPGEARALTLRATFDEDMKQYCLSAWYYDTSANEYRRMCGICWRIKDASPGSGEYATIDIDCVEP